MHQRIAALFISFAVTSLVALVGWELARYFPSAQPPAGATTQAIEPPAISAANLTSPASIASNESVASR